MIVENKKLKEALENKNLEVQSVQKTSDMMLDTIKDLREALEKEKKERNNRSLN